MSAKPSYYLLAGLLMLLLGSCGKKDSPVAPTPVEFSWQEIAGPPGGNVRTLAINASGHVFAASQDSGLFRSTDNGTSWTAVNTGLTNEGGGVPEVWCVFRTIVNTQIGPS